MRQSQSNTTRSHIPIPIRKRSQSSPPARNASKHVTTASVRRRCSSSNIQHIETPVTSMCWSGSIPQTAQSSRSTVFGSRDCGLYSKPVLKDPGPLSDKQFQNAEVQKVQNYFLQREDRDFKMNTPNALRMRSLTFKMFVEMMSHLLLHFFPECIINMSNYADEIPLITKKLGYPGSAQKSWLIKANLCHSWPYVVGLLSWLVDLVRCIKQEKFMNIMFSHKEEEEVPENFLD